MKDFLKHICLEAGKISLEFKAKLTHLAIDKKSEKDLVTEADTAIDSFLVSQIARRYPDHAIVSEESGEKPGNDYCWVIDPIDGTTSFVHDQPCYAVSIAVQRQGKTVLAAIHLPVFAELFEAQKQQGATCNDKPIHVSKCDSLINSVVSTGFACLRANVEPNNLPCFNAIAPLVRGIRRYGSTAFDLCYVACGRIDGYWEMNLQPYDMAAGLLIASEAGARCTNFSGISSNLCEQLLATNGLIHDELAIYLLRALKPT